MSAGPESHHERVLPEVLVVDCRDGSGMLTVYRASTSQLEYHARKERADGHDAYIVSQAALRDWLAQNQRKEC